MTEWYQQALTPPSVTEVRVRLGVVPESDHAQVMVEVLDPVTNVLIGQWSIPHAALAGWPSLLEQAVEKAHQMLGDAIEPF